jgi:phytanoyl-CoA hydroxylase
LKYLRETPRDTPLEEIRQRYQRDGYVLLKGLLPREDILKFRKQFFDFISPIGICQDGKEAEGIFSGKSPDEPTATSNSTVTWAPELKEPYYQRMEEAHVMPEYLEICEHPAIIQFIKEFAGWKNPTLYKRALLRVNMPGGELTQVHYDKMFLRAGDPGFLTAWVPLGDIDIRGGGLAYLEDSIPIAQEIEINWLKAAEHLPDEEKVSAYNKAMTDGARCSRDASEFSNQTGRKWLVSNYEAGDVVFHHGFLIHTSCINEDPNNLIRLATDLRYGDSEKKIDQRWMNYWKVGDGL